jgi:outer membrane PBP1 activator LpoA protein
MKHLLTRSIALGALAIGLAACNGETEAQEEIDEKAEAIEASYDAEAQLIEAQAENAPDEKQAEDQADAVRAEGDKAADHLKEMGDELDEGPKPAE